MPYAYPPLAPVLTGNVITTHNLLKDPTSVQRRIEDLARHGFVSDILFPIGVEAPGGAISYSMTEPVMVADDPISVAPGGQYQLALATGGAPQLAKVTKYGQDSRVTDEDIGRLKINAVERAMTQLVNATIDFIDTLALGIAAAAVTQTQAAVAVWNNASADPFKDILRAKAKIKNLNPTLGYEPDLLVLSSLLYAELVGNDKVVAGLQVNNQNVVIDGMVMQIAGVRLADVPESRMPVGVGAMLVDTRLFGHHGYEPIPSPEYQGDPDGIQTWTRRDPLGTDSYLLRNRRTFVPVVENPNAGIKITGVAA